jgi:hypothetical protein
MLFQQHDRWLEELLEYTNREEAVTCRDGYLTLTAIAQEIATACADARVHDHKQKASWESMAADLFDTLDWIGPGLLALVDCQWPSGSPRFWPGEVPTPLRVIG